MPRTPGAFPGAGPGPQVRRRPPVRPWYRTRAYRLTRTLVVAAALTTGCVWWAGDPAPPTVTAAPGAHSPGSDAKSVLPASGPAARSTPPAARAAARGVPPYPSPSRATRLVIPYLDVDAPVMPLPLGRDRHLTAPPVDDPNLVGWYTGGPAPGRPGTAVAVGHLDTHTARAVFAGLKELTPGHLVEVRRADERTAVYTVDKVTTYDKKSFPDREVYGDRGRAELRLITCAGRYDRKAGYSANTVVFAHLTEVRKR
ncbi:class F sortase [Streptomyces sp. 4F14]|uniref:class F sortase n=1 Tax=Streptomyces sp. 4F14 TaxID=3394380 RepID=UPI003A844988